MWLMMGSAGSRQMDKKRSISSLSDDYLQEPCEVVALSYSVEAPFDKIFFWTPGQEEEYLVFVG